MKIKMERFGLPYNPRKELANKNKITNQIISFLCIFVLIAMILAVFFSVKLRNYVACFAINETIDSVWVGSLASYWGGIIGGVFSGSFAFLGVFYTIKYYKESDMQKERASIQPFLLVALRAHKDIPKGFSLGPNSGKEKNKEIKVTIKNIGNGFANTLVVHTGFNLGGFAYNKLIQVNEAEYLFFMANPEELQTGVSFQIQFIDSMRNEYMQEYQMIEKNGHIDIECGYPRLLEQR